MMRLQDGGSRPAAGSAKGIWKIVLALACAAVFLPQTAVAGKNTPDYITVANAPKVRVGTATVERLGSIFEAGAGPFIAARAGDWRLSNEHIQATFASLDDTTTILRQISMPINGFQDEPPAPQHIPGALIDLSVDGYSLDFMHSYTQIVGDLIQGTPIPYDTITPVKREDAVGLQVDGWPFENSSIRVETTYWLAPGSYRMQIETRITGIPEGEEAPRIVDAGNWGYGALLVNTQGLIFAADSDEALDTDFYQVQGGPMTIGVVAAAGTRFKGRCLGQPAMTRAVLMFDDRPTTSPALEEMLPYLKDLAKHRKAPADAKTTPTQAAAQPQTPPASVAQPRKEGQPDVIRRELWVLNGSYGALQQRIQEARKVPTGTLSGMLTAGDQSTPVPHGRIRVQKINQASLTQEPPVYTVIESDKNGRYEVKLPVGFYFLIPEPKSLYQPGGGMRLSREIVADKTKTADLRMVPESGVHVRVLDAATSKPLAARLRIEAIPPTPPINLGYPHAARAYIDNAYIPAKGGDLFLQPGRWIIYANHGIGYDNGDLDVTVEGGKLTDCVIRLKQSNPTPGWAHVELGVRTRATPGCTIEAGDVALMATAEGIDWLVSGDYEKLTDLRPALDQHGLSGVIGTSRGFRTTLPAHPEWGQFLIFPVKSDAPEPAQVRAQWAELKTAREFIATLRKLYPGALIQSELPFTSGGLGYFAIKGKDAYEFSYDVNPEIETGIDAVNIFPSRRHWDVPFTKGFWINNMLRDRFYLGSTSNSGTCIFGAEPGYPRLLAFVGKGVKLNEDTVFGAIRGHRTQVTTGPFIDFSVNGNMPGGICARDESFKIHLRVTAPKWIDTSSLAIEKEDHTKLGMMLGSSETAPQRFPAAQGDPAGLESMTLKKMMLDPERDTLLSVSIRGSQPLRPWLPSLSPSDEVPAFAITYPIVIDTNGNNKYDPIQYWQKGT